MRYRKKPVEIEAMQHCGDSDVSDVIDWILANGGTARWHDDGGNRISIDTLEGTMSADIGDWIIRGVKGEFYPCKPDIFEATYDDATTAPPRTIRIVFEPVVDEHTGHDELRFIEIENDRGESIVVGTWHEGDGWRWLTIDLPSVQVDPRARLGVRQGSSLHIGACPRSNPDPDLPADVACRCGPELPLDHALRPEPAGDGFPHDLGRRR